MKKILFISLAVVFALSVGLIGCEGEGEDIGDPIELIHLIRTEDERQDIGDYSAGVLEDLGFTVTRQYGTSGDLAPLWLGDPELGTWHAYTGGWISTAIERDAGSNFGFFYTTLGAAIMGPLWAAYVDEGDFYDDCEALWYNDFSTPAEREALFEDAMWASMNDSVRIMLLDRLSFSPLRHNVHCAADSYGGIYGSWLWANTVHFNDASYGAGNALEPTGNTTLRMATTDLFIHPWNPVAGSNWAYDMFPIRATGDNGFEYDPNTGLQWPHRASTATVTWVDGLPIVYDGDHTGWLTTATVPDPIPVPGTALYDFDAASETWDTVADVLGSNVTALTKCVVEYPDTIWTVPMHDGNTLDDSDFMFYAIMQFVRADPASPLYDPSYVPTYDAFMSHFKGVEFEFNPGGGIGLRVTTYDDSYYLDAELIAGDEQRCWFPSDDQGPWAWHTIALGILAEEDLALCFSQDKSTEEEVEWTSFIAGPSLAILEGYLDDVRTPADPDEDYIPFATTMGSYVTPAEAGTRYDNLETYWAANGNFWVATGPYYLTEADTTGNVIELTRHATYPDAGDMWFDLMDPVPSYTGSHTGGWCDLITIEVLSQAEAITQLGNDDIDVFAFGVADSDLKDICDADANIWYYDTAGAFNDLTYNPVGPFFPGTGKLNPFAIPEVRQAMNWAIDRSYICGTIMSGMGVERFNAVGSLSGDGVKYSTILTAIDSFYAYDFDTADAIIEAEMLAIPGVSRDTDGKYYYKAP